MVVGKQSKNTNPNNSRCSTAAKGSKTGNKSIMLHKANRISSPTGGTSAVHRQLLPLWRIILIALDKLRCSPSLSELATTDWLKMAEDKTMIMKKSCEKGAFKLPL